MARQVRNGAAAEFERQLGHLLTAGYPRAAGLGQAEFRALVEPLRDRLADAGPDGFVIVVKREVVPAGTSVGMVERRGKAGFTVLADEELERFDPIPDVRLPAGPAYLVVDVDTGADSRNVTPDDALGAIRRAGRSPLTVEEGIALVTHDPEAVAVNAGFSLLGSRCGDRRVTALWISEGRPKLGWCWAGNPHTWLGSASCGRRVGAA